MNLTFRQKKSTRNLPKSFANELSIVTDKNQCTNYLE